MILGISEGSQDISPQSMANRQQALLDEVSKDPAVVSAVGYIGPGGATVTENDGACSSPSSRRGRGAQSTR